MVPRWLIVFVSLALIGCGGTDPAADPNIDRDPAVTNALNDPIMTDPDLANQNQGGAALTGGGPASAEIPPERRSREEIDAAKAQAVQLAGGPIAAAPDPVETRGTSRLDRAITAPAIADALALGGKGCAAAMGYSAIWAARLAPPFDVYPRGHVGQAAGVDSATCKLRVVSFVTPVAPADVIAFYAMRARATGHTVRRSSEGGDDLLQGVGAGVSYAVAARLRDDKLSEITLITSKI